MTFVIIYSGLDNSGLDRLDNTGLDRLDGLDGLDRFFLRLDGLDWLDRLDRFYISNLFKTIFSL